jgi:dienelactone hydrolase
MRVQMAEAIVFHHAQGLTDGVLAFVEELRRAGHTVHAPDLYEGHAFAALAEGVAYAQRLGFDAIAERAAAAAAALPARIVYVGISLGVLPAQRLAQTRPGARGGVLISACFPSAEFGQGWPPGVPLQVHGMEADPEFANEWDLPAARALVNEVEDSELFLYPGDQHLFMDSSLPDFDEEATALLARRTLALLGQLA